MFDLQKYSSRLAIRSDIGESITYAELTVETENFTTQFRMMVLFSFFVKT